MEARIKSCSQLWTSPQETLGGLSINEKQMIPNFLPPGSKWEAAHVYSLGAIPPFTRVPVAWS